MIFEAHITVDSKDVEAWQEFCREEMIKPLYIRLTRGSHPDQLMCSVPFSADLEATKQRVSMLEAKIRNAGFLILRSKLECQLAHSALIQTPAYYEYHMKLTLDEAGVTDLLPVAKKLSVGVSTNLLAMNGKWERWYLTGRDYTKNMGIASDEFRRLRRQVEQYFSVEGMDMECVIFDTNPGLDEGWIDVPVQ